MTSKNFVKLGMNSLVSPVLRFIQVESSSGIVLMLVTVLALLAANSPLQLWYFEFINMPVSVSFGEFELNKTLLLLVNDGLMAIFFYLVGLEIKREILVGELSTPKKASFSIFAALGGMVFPALIFTMFNLSSGFSSGWGVPMATDIAFAVGVLTLLGSRVPSSLKVFLLALAIVDDLGAILVIALFYSGEIYGQYLGVAAGALVLLALLNYAGLRNMVIGIGLGLVVWFCFLKSGIHATIAGVILAFLTPAKKVDAAGELQREGLLIDHYIHGLHPWVAFGIMPIFAFFNAGVSLAGVNLAELIVHPVSLGIGVGLIVGNPLGIFAMTFLASRIGLAVKPEGTTWSQIIAIGALAGVGFTMSLFINSLAFQNQPVEGVAKVAILGGSAIAMVIGLTAVFLTTRKQVA